MSLNNQLSDGNPNGTIIGQGPLDRVSMYNAVPIAQRSSPMQSIIQGGPMGQVVTMSFTGALTAAGTITSHNATEIAGTITPLPNDPKLLTTDFVFAVNKNNGTFNAGVGIAGARVAGANSIGINFTNNTAATLTPAAGDVYNVVVLRGITPLSVALSPVSVAASSQAEQVFSLAPTTLAVLGTPHVDSAGGIDYIPVAVAGAGYTVPPTVNISSGTPGATTLTGTFTGIGMDFSLNAPPPAAVLAQLTQQQVTGSGGYGASAIAILGTPGATGAGTVIGIQMTKRGKNYNSNYPPTASLVGGTYVSLGQVAQVNKLAQQAGLGITNVRVIADNQLGITYCNYTAAIITPTAPEVYQVVALNEIPAVSPWVEVGVSITSTNATPASILVTEYSASASGVLVTDMPSIPIKPSKTTGMATVGGRCAANAIIVAFINPTQAAVTPAGPEVYTVPILKAAPMAPATLTVQLLTPASVAANTTAEQTFTVPGLVFTNSVGSTVEVRKPSKTLNIDVVGFRVTATDTLGITFQNNSAAAIVPPAEYYSILNFQDVSPVASTTVVGGFTAAWMSPTWSQNLDLTNEIQQSKTMIGAIKGA